MTIDERVVAGSYWRNPVTKTLARVLVVRPNDTLDWNAVTTVSARSRRFGSSVTIRSFTRNFEPAEAPTHTPADLTKCRFCAEHRTAKIEESRTWLGFAVCRDRAACAARFRINRAA